MIHEHNGVFVFSGYLVTQFRVIGYPEHMAGSTILSDQENFIWLFFRLNVFESQEFCHTFTCEVDSRMVVSLSMCVGAISNLVIRLDSSNSQGRLTLHLNPAQEFTTPEFNLLVWTNQGYFVPAKTKLSP